mmetsp:Transcript_13111/g.39455  ORF Transcript_13111/g.39455 Transcript_13111/m.39455 type:complete len:229 (-) Transcript_13111:205-891(-)
MLSPEVVDLLFVGLLEFGNLVAETIFMLPLPSGHLGGQITLEDLTLGCHLSFQLCLALPCRLHPLGFRVKVSDCRLVRQLQLRLAPRKLSRLLALERRCFRLNLGILRRLGFLECRCKALIDVVNLGAVLLLQCCDRLGMIRFESGKLHLVVGRLLNSGLRTFCSQTTGFVQFGFVHFQQAGNLSFVGCLHRFKLIGVTVLGVNNLLGMRRFEPRDLVRLRALEMTHL